MQKYTEKRHEHDTRYFPSTTVSGIYGAGHIGVENTLTAVSGTNVQTVFEEMSIKDEVYASSTIKGHVKMRLDGTTLYITNDGTDA